MRVFLGLLFLLPLLTTTAAPTDFCAGQQPALGILQVTGGTADTTFYVDDRNYVTGNGLWIYEETNGVWSGHTAGLFVGDPDHVDLQRGNLRLLGGYWPDDYALCVDDWDIESDLLVF